MRPAIEPRMPLYAAFIAGVSLSRFDFCRARRATVPPRSESATKMAQLVGCSRSMSPAAHQDDLIQHARRSPPQRQLTLFRRLREPDRQGLRRLVEGPIRERALLIAAAPQHLLGTASEMNHHEVGLMLRLIGAARGAQVKRGA